MGLFQGFRGTATAALLAAAVAVAPAAGQDSAPDSPQGATGKAVETEEGAAGKREESGGGYVVPEVQYDLSALPYPAQQMHRLLVEAARSGQIEKLRPYIGKGDDQTLLSFGELDEDPIEFLKKLSGDGEGYEILAILLDVLAAGYVHVEAGSENEMYVWPYFYGLSLSDLTPPQRVELYRIVTHGDFQEMEAFGAYSFYRVGITAQGRWRFFVAGD